MAAIIKRYAILLIVILLGASIGLSISYKVNLFLIPLVICLTAILFYLAYYRPLYALWLLMITTILGGIFFRPEFRYFNPILLIELEVLVFFITGLLKLFQGEGLPRFTAKDLLVGLFLLLLVLYTLFNKMPLLSVFVGLRLYFKGLLVYYGIRFHKLFSAVNQKETVVKLLIGLVLLQVPIVFAEFWKYGPGDTVSGTLGYMVTPTLIYVSGFATAFLIYKFLTKLNWLYLGLAALTFLLPWWGDANAFLVYVPLAVIFALRSYFFKLKPLLMLAAVILVSGLVLSHTSTGMKMYSGFMKGIDFEVNTQYADWWTTSGRAPSRPYSIELAWDEIGKSNQALFLGYGLGSASQSDGMYFTGVHLNPDFPWRNQLSVSLIENGVLGLAFLYLLFVAFWKQPKGSEPDGVSVITDAMFILYLSMTVYYITYADHVASLLLWIMLGVSSERIASDG